jgi:Heavy metal associated domain 2
MNSQKSSDAQKYSIIRQQQPQIPLASDAAPQEISYSIAHAIPGRIRFRIPRIATDAWYADKLKAVMEFHGMTDVRINPEAASIVIKYKSDTILPEKMRYASSTLTRSHLAVDKGASYNDSQTVSQLIKLIQAAPNIDIPKQPTVKSVVESIFDALVNLIDSIRNVNNVRSAMKHQQPNNSTWERILSTARRMLKGLKSAIMFVTPKRKANLSKNSEEQLLVDF